MTFDRPLNVPGRDEPYRSNDPYDPFSRQFKSETVEGRLEALEKKISDINVLIPVLDSIIKTGKFDIRGLLRIIGGELHIGGGANVEGVSGAFHVPLIIFDDPGLISKRAGGMGVGTNSKDLNAEQTNVAIVNEMLEKLEPSDLSGNETPPLQSEKIANMVELLLTHSTFDDATYNSFFWALRNPIVISTGRIINGGTVLTDLGQNWEVNELAGATLYLTGSTTEAYEIASNTANTITITGGTWASTSNEYSYQVSRPVYLGAANGPWRRLYVEDDIRFGIGPSGGSTVIWIKFGSGSPESVVTANVGSLYLRTDGGAGTTLYIKESGTGATGWIGK